MAFVEVICKNCGGKIILDDKMKSGVCEYCKTTFVREDTNITNHFHNNTTVVYNTDSTIEEKLKSADVHLNKLNNYENAKEIYEYVIKNKADDYRGWWGMALVLSRKLTYIECDADRFAEIKGYAENAMKVADGEHKKEISALWNDYSRKFEEHKEKERIERQEKENIRLALEKKQKKSRAIRKSIGIALSLICNIGLLIWYFSMEDISELNENDWTALFIFLGVLFGNSILTTIFGKIGSTASCAGLPLIVNIITIATTIIKGFWGSEHDIVVIIIGAIIFIAGGLVAVAVCSFIPLVAFKDSYISSADTYVILDEELED